MDNHDCDWTANARLADARQHTVTAVGACQGVCAHDGRLYLFGDLTRSDGNPVPGAIAEFSLDLTPTGRAIRLAGGAGLLITHPTGLSFDRHLGVVLGNTVHGTGTIYQIDWPRALEDGDLRRAVRAVVDDDAAVNGCRPEFVDLGGRRYLATADYGKDAAEVRFYDVCEMVERGRTSVVGVVRKRVPCGPYNQSLHWDASTGRLYIVQNVVAGLGWRLEILDLDRVASDDAVEAAAGRLDTLTFPPHTELEGFSTLEGDASVFVTSHRRDNVVVGRIERTAPTPTPRGTTQLVL